MKLLPIAPFRVICTMIVACFLLASCSRNSDPAKVSITQKRDIWANAEVTRENVHLILERASGDGVVGITQVKDIQVEGANNKTVTVDLKHETADPDLLMKNTAETLITYSKILFENNSVGTVEVCMFGNPDANGKPVSKEMVRIAINREDLQKGQDVIKLPVESYSNIFRHASWYKIHPHLYKQLHHKDKLKIRAYLK